MILLFLSEQDSILSQWSNFPSLIKVTVFFIVWLGVWLPIAIPLSIKLQWRPGQPITVAQKLPLLASLYLLAPFVLAAAAVLEGNSFADYGLAWQRPIFLSLGTGLLMGALGLALMFAIELAIGWIKFQPAQVPQPLTALFKTLLLTLLLAVWVSATEELIFRGFLLNQFQQDYFLWSAAAIASLIFALLHLIWEGRDNVPQLLGLWLMGMVLALARWVDGGSLGLAWGLHAGWIWAIASLDTTQAIHYTEQAPTWLTGLDNKPLAGGMGLLFLLATGGILWCFY